MMLPTCGPALLSYAVLTLQVPTLYCTTHSVFSTYDCISPT